MNLTPTQHHFGLKQIKLPVFAQITRVPALLSFLTLCLFASSCKKDNPAPVYSQVVVKNPGGTTTGNGDLRDTLAEYAYAFYLWNANIPATFSPHSYPQPAVDTLDHMMSAFQSFSPLNAVNGEHYDHFSFTLTEADYQNLFVKGTSVGYGTNYKFDRNNRLRFSYVAHASYAYSQGIRRGWQINSVNGTTVTRDQAGLAYLNKTLFGNAPLNLVVTNPATSAQVNVTLTAGSVADDEVIATKVFTAGTKTVGYLAYNTFLTATTGSGTPVHPGLDSAFRNLKAGGITDLIVDLRYNGGGYTDVAQQLDNALIPASFDGKVMYTEHYNDTLNYYHKHGYPGVPSDTTIYIKKANSANPPGLNVSSVTFIVSDETASASELTINNLFPYFPNAIKIIGTGAGLASTRQNTAGKPFGYAGSLSLPNKNPLYEAFLINFETKNGSGQDNYVSGFTPDLQTYDGVEYDWGNPLEDPLQAALNYLKTGTLTRPANPTGISNATRIQSAGAYNPYQIGRNPARGFSGMLSHRFVLARRQAAGTGLNSTNVSLSKMRLSTAAKRKSLL